MKFSFKLMLAGLVILILNPQLHAQVAFALAGNYVMGVNSVSATAADINGDGQTDLIVANNGILILTNNGNGQFGSNAMLAVTVAGSVVADVDSDGKPDLIFSDGGFPGHLFVYTNNGNGGFGSNAVYAVGNVPGLPFTVDVNNDGKLDIICANEESATLSVLTNNGNGAFNLSSSPATGTDGNPGSVVAVDVNNDGKMDLICPNNGYPGIGHTLSVLTNGGGGIFKLASTPTVGSGPNSLVAIDVNGDGKVDLICANVYDNTLSVLTNNGSGGFGSNATLIVGSRPICLVAADVNGDGKMDLICGNNNGNTLSVLTNNGSGIFGSNAVLKAITRPVGIIAADFNGDSKMDVVCVNGQLSSNTHSALSVLVNVPTLTSIYSSNNLTVSWPSSWTNWTLSQNPDLTTTNWTASTGIANDGTNKSVTVPALTNNLFFRLAHP